MFTGTEWIQLAGKVIELCFDIAKYVQKIRNVDSTLAKLFKEINQFAVVVTSIERQVNELEVAGFIERCGWLHWETIWATVQDAKIPLEKFANLLVQADRKGRLPDLLRRVKGQMRLDLNAKEIEMVRGELMGCVHFLTASLVMVQVYSSLREG
jgi:hypothetical protein